MLELKPLSKEAIPSALEKAERYRLLNEAVVAESICCDILDIAPENQDALIMLILALTDQFEKSSAGSVSSVKRTLELIPNLHNAYQRAYYTGIIYERQAKAKLQQHYPGSHYDTYNLLITAMSWFEQAEALQPAGNEDAILRWNTCTRLIRQNKLHRRPKDDFKPYLE